MTGIKGFGWEAQSGNTCRANLRWEMTNSNKNVKTVHKVFIKSKNRNNLWCTWGFARLVLMMVEVRERHPEWLLLRQWLVYFMTALQNQLPWWLDDSRVPLDLGMWTGLTTLWWSWFCVACTFSPLSLCKGWRYGHHLSWFEFDMISIPALAPALRLVMTNTLL